MAYHNETCGCAECRNYGQTYNPTAIHNQSCGCAACQNYTKSTPIAKSVPRVTQQFEMVAVPIELVAEVHALIAKRK